MMESRPLRAAVVGGSGFGRFHAQWYAREGAEVVGYTCTTPESAASAAEAMQRLTGQRPKAYDDVTSLLESETPDVVSICSPPPSHVEPALEALRAGAHVLCEKPLVYDPRRTPSEMIDAAGGMVEAAETAGRALAVNLQYAALLGPYFELFQRDWGPFADVRSYEFDMESKGNRLGPIQYERAWVELGPHALTPLISLRPTASPVKETLKAEMTEKETLVEVEFEEPGGFRYPVRIRTAACGKDDAPRRRFGFNGYFVDIQSQKDAEGTFQTVLSPVESKDPKVLEDLMRLSIRRFLQAARGDGVPLVSGEQGKRNLEVMLLAMSALNGRSRESGVRGR